MKARHKLVLALLGALASWMLLRHLGALEWLARSAEHARGLGLPGALLGGVAILVGTLLLLPLYPFLVLAGWVWGPWGVAVVLPSAMLSTAAAFLLARAFAGSDAAQALRTHPRLEHVVELAERGGALTVALLRVSLVVPFTPGNVALGLTRMRLGQVMLGTPLGMAVPAAVFVGFGAALPDAGAILRGDFFPSGRWALAGTAAGLVTMVALAALVTRRLHREHAASRDARAGTARPAAGAPPPPAPAPPPAEAPPA